MSDTVMEAQSAERQSRFLQNVSRKTSVSQFPALPSTVPVELSRVMLPDDSNPMGNVHGGVILKLVDHAGNIVATRHCNRNSADGTPLLTVLARVDHMDFHQPMYVGELAQLQAAVTYTSPHSLEITVDVWAENIISGSRRHTNAATLWYVAVPADEKCLKIKGGTVKAVSVPQLATLTEEERDAGQRRYEAQKEARKAKVNGSTVSQGLTHFEMPLSPDLKPEDHTISRSQTTLANLVLPSDCMTTGYLMGGSLMKIMDNAAGICAARHCRSLVVTACIDAIDFHGPIMNGEVVFVTSRMVFTSTKSMEIEVTTEAEGLDVGSRRVTNTAYFTFVSLGADKRATAVPPLKLKSDEELQRFEEGRQRYETRKRLRQEMIQKWQKKQALL